MHHNQSLCRSYDPFREYPGIYTKTFLPANMQISLRPFHIARDLALVNKWFNCQFAHIKESIRDPFQYTEDYYTTLLAGANSQPLLGSIDHHPSFQVDIYQAILGPDCLLDNTTVCDRDFILQLMLSPEAVQNLSLSMYALLGCLDCFFNYAEVNRVIWMTNCTERDLRFIADMAELEELACNDYQSFFNISKERFRAVQFHLPVFPQHQAVAIG